MVKLDTSLSPTPLTLQTLHDTQNAINTLATYALQKEQAIKYWENRTTNAAFAEIKELLKIMAYGAQRCAYCEDSVGDEIEHIRPKSLYPQSCFVWTNYLYACGSCNAPKNNFFAVFLDTTNAFFEIIPAHYKTTPPPSGQDAFINPRVESSLDYWELDLIDFDFRLVPTVGTNDYQKAKYTLDLLKLSHQEREYLRAARKSAYDNYKNAIEVYLSSPHNESRIKNQIRKQPQPTVWAEIKRQYLNAKLARVDKEFYNMIAQAADIILAF